MSDKYFFFLGFSTFWLLNRKLKLLFLMKNWLMRTDSLSDYTSIKLLSFLPSILSSIKLSLIETVSFLKLSISELLTLLLLSNITSSELTYLNPTIFLFSFLLWYNKFSSVCFYWELAFSIFIWESDSSWSFWMEFFGVFVLLLD